MIDKNSYNPYKLLQLFVFLPTKDSVSGTGKYRLKKPHFFSLKLNRELLDLRKIYVVNLITGRPKKMPYVGEFAA